MSTHRIRYAGSTQSLAVTLVHTWKRGDIDRPVMSASSGPKDYVKNDIFAIFDQNQDVDSITMVVGNATPFLILRKGDKYFDAQQKEVEIAAVKAKGAGA